jgi:hypothetical protein
MADDLRVVFRVVNDNKDLNKSLKKSQTELGKTKKGVDKVSKSFNKMSLSARAFSSVLSGVRSRIASIGPLIAGVAAGFTLKSAVDEAVKLENAFVGLQSISRLFSLDTDKVQGAAKALAAEGLIPLSDVIGSLKNLLLATNGDLGLAVNAFKKFRDIASFNRQGQLELGTAILRTTDGIKNQISTLTDNIGATENISSLNKKYAESIGKTVNQLTEQEKRMGTVLGLMKEAERATGDFALLLNTFSGSISLVSTNWRFFLAEVGEIVTKNPVVLKVLNSFSASLGEMTASLNKNSKEIKRFVSDTLTVFINTIEGASTAITILGTVIASVAAGGAIASLVAGIKSVGVAGLLMQTQFAAGLVLMKSSFLAMGGIVAATVASATLLSFKIGELIKTAGSLENAYEGLKVTAVIVGIQMVKAFNEVGLSILNLVKKIPFIEKVADLSILNNSIKEFKETISDADKEVDKLRLGLVKIARNKVVVDIKAPKKIPNSDDLLKSLKDVFKNPFSVKTKIDTKATEQARKAAEKSVENLGLSNIQVIRKVQTERIKAIKESRAERLRTINETQQSSIKAVREDLKKRLSTSKELSKLTGNERKAAITRNTILRANAEKTIRSINQSAIRKRFVENKSAVKTITDLRIKAEKDVATERSKKSLMSFQSFASGAQAVIGGITQGGEEGAKSAIKGIIATVGQNLGPYAQLIAGIINSAIDLLARSKESFRKLHISFAKGFVSVFSKIVGNISQLISGPLTKEILQSFLTALPQLAQAIGEAYGAAAGDPSFPISIASAFVSGFLKAIPAMIGAFATGVAKGFKRGFGLFKDNFTRFFSNFSIFKTAGEKMVEGFREAFSKLGGLFKKVFQFSGEGRGPIEKLLGFDMPFMKFSKGGVVPGRATVQGDSEKNDKIRALLSPGEVVIPRSAANKGMSGIIDFLRGQKSIKSGQVQSSGQVQKFGFGSFIKNAFEKVKTPTEIARDAARTAARVSNQKFNDKVLRTFNDIARTAGVDKLFDVIVPSELRGIIESLTRIGGKFSISRLIANPKNEVSNAVVGARDFFTPSLRKVLRPVGLQNGGVIPQGFNNDTFPAMLSSGERVLTANENNDFEKLVDSNNRIENLLGSLVSIMSSPQKVETSVDLDERSFANIMLELSRTNARTA